MAEITSVGVVGAGTMGHGIAQVAAQAGYQTVLYDVSRELVDKGLARITGNLNQGLAKGKVTAEEKDATLSRLTATAELKELAPCGLVIEAAPEQMVVKQSVFQKLAELCGPDAVLATNTSSLSVTEIAAAVPR